MAGRRRAELATLSSQVEEQSRALAESGRDELSEPSKLHASDVDRIRAFLSSHGAKSTREQYAMHWHRYSEFCARRGANPLSSDPMLVCAFLVWLAGRPASLQEHLEGVEWPEGPSREGEKPYSLQSIGQAHAALRRAHKFARAGRLGKLGGASLGPDPTADPAVSIIMRSIRDALSGEQTVQQKAAVTVEMVRSMVDGLGYDGRSLRDRAMILCGMSLALRRSELVALRVEDVVIRPDGALVTIRRSKTDQRGKGHMLALRRLEQRDVCPVASIEAWLAYSRLTAGPLFRGIHPTSGKLLVTGITAGHFVARLKRAAKDAGLDYERIAGHSLRAGLITEAARSGVSMIAVSKVSRHRSMDVLAGYFRPVDAMEAEVGSKIGLGNAKAATK